MINLTVENKWLPIKINTGIIETAFKLAGKNNNNVLAIVLASKPCFYKLFSVWQEAKNKKLPHILVHTGQHYDKLMSFGLKEFNFNKEISIDLQIRGDLSQKSAELFSKFKRISLFIKERWPLINLVPYVNGDTISAGIIPIAWTLATNQKAIHGEAGLRGMSPEFFLKFNEKEHRDIDKFIKKQFRSRWIINRTEPFPEQIDTFIAAAGCRYLFAPQKLNRRHLINEGYSKDDIFVTGNTVVDVMNLIKNEKPEESIFDLYPKLKEGEWLRVDIHRRENLTKKRFKAIIGSIIKLTNNGKKIVFIELDAGRKALEHYGLREGLLGLNKRSKNFLFTPVWKRYSQVIEFIKSEHCWAVMTDSGSLQEEMNELQKPCLTVRFSTDRPETVMMAHSNVLVPPISKEFIAKMVYHIYGNRQLRRTMSRGKKLYGRNVAEKIISTIEKLFKNNKSMFKWAHEELKIYKETDKNFRYL